MKAILSITGSDSTGVSGVQADIRIIASLGGYAASAITSVTVQNTLGIQEFYDLPAPIVKGQIEAIVNDMEPAVVKIGMIRCTDVLQVIVDILVKYRPEFVIYDPIVRSANGEQLMSADVIARIRHQLLPLCSLIVVRRQEAEAILGNRQWTAAHILDDAVLHGKQNAFSAALAAFMAQGQTKEQALGEAMRYLSENTTPHERPKGVGEKLFNRFLSLVQTHYQTNSDVAFYADILNVSPTYLAQVCHRVSGAAPKIHIDRQITEAISRDLLHSERTVQEIAFSYGFSSPSHFSKFFKKQKGMSPSEYRHTFDKPSEQKQTSETQFAMPWQEKMVKKNIK